MAHELGIRVVAEGVESPEQMLVLRDSGCDEVQGFVICRPLPAQEVLPYLRALGGAGVEGGATHPRQGVSVG
jgi:EAL domain-containing protein (putative c-di-GMP-specific phosphodiesterase class I)